LLLIGDTLSSLPEVHQLGLRWFGENKGRRVSWAEMKKRADEGLRLSTAAKGIYKPAYTDFALSVRTIQDGPYPDKEVEYRPDGSWVCQYFQENPNPTLRDREATNRGLILCMEQRVPVGFLIKRKSKPRAEYDVLGLGLVTSWDQGYFTINGFSSAGTLDLDTLTHDAATARTKVLGHDDVKTDSVLRTDQDLREFQLSSVAIRRGKAKFRNSLLIAYGSRCCISGCDVTSALEAAHISPYRGEQSNQVSNGLLLRADLHTLFDLGLLALDDQLRTILAPELCRSEHYKELSGLRIHLPPDEAKQPSLVAISAHRKWAAL
jgi:putative restriction endonuclease